MASQAEQLRQAAAAGQADAVRDLLLAGAKIDPDLEGRTALHRAAANGHLASVKTLLDFGAKLNVRDAAGYTPLHQAATEGHQEITALLLSKGCYVDAQDELHGNTPLHEAAWKGFSQTVEVLCKNKANVYIKNNGGFTPLHLTCQNGHNQSCRIVLLSGCKPDVRNSYGDTALHTAARYGHAGVLRILVSAFCSVNEMNKNGDTALHISAAMGKRKLTKILLEAGCDQKVKNNQNETARDIAERKGFSEVMSILDNPPVTLIPVVDGEKARKSEKKSSKKREKDSGASQESSSKDKKDKHKKSKKKQSVHFGMDQKLRSPYGCHMYPNMEMFPPLNIKSLPSEPLEKGEQYYVDLAGNIKKGPRGVGYTCYCTPFFGHVEKKMDANKNELLKHIDVHNEDLKAKITHLEQRTHDQLFNLNQKMKENLALERADCCERMDRRMIRERLEVQNFQKNGIQSLRSEVQSWVHPPPSNGCHPPIQIRDYPPLSRSKSADLLSDNDSQQWSTEVTSTNNTVQSSKTSNFLNYAKQRFYTSSKNNNNNGARPKTTNKLFPKAFHWHDKACGNSMLTRDSRSEGDLRSCQEDSDYPKNDSNPIQEEEGFEQPGALWNRNRNGISVTATESHTQRVIQSPGCNGVTMHQYGNLQINNNNNSPIQSVRPNNIHQINSNGKSFNRGILPDMDKGSTIRMQIDDSSFV